ncbi:hypothetical protein VKT23_018160 [Stygiomarasmius scandens]|uniref:Cytochrome P450 n=1 Tax=Marasmiellus scandens TaxID=2682957 RepID=A0ABR1IQ83_9AGAR
MSGLHFDMIHDPFKLGILGLLIVLVINFIKAYHERSKVTPPSDSWLIFSSKSSYPQQLKHIPTLGPDGLLTSYITVYKHFLNAADLIQEGYRKYPNGVFKIPTINGWWVVLNSTNHLNDIRKATDEQFSNAEALDEILSTYYTVHPNLSKNPYHIDVIRFPLTRNIGAGFGEVHDELKAAFADKIPSTVDWVEFKAYNTMLDIIVRVANRFFVGLPLCRNPDYCDLNIKFTLNVGINSLIINIFPLYLHPIVGYIFSGRRSALKRMMKHLKPIIEARFRMREQYGNDWFDKPTFTSALFELAAHPEYVEPLRQEIERIVAREGWTKAGMGQMKLLDSFLKESARLNGLSSLGDTRKAVKDYTFSDGTFVPAGTWVNAAIWTISRDETYFPGGTEFRPFRFAELRDRDDGKENTKHQFTNPEEGMSAFGVGRHACPGRFFASTEIKALLAHVLLNYDVKLPDNSKQVPPLFKFSFTIGANRDAKVLFRKRRVD